MSAITIQSDAELLAECRLALGYNSLNQFARFLGYRDDNVRVLRRYEKGKQEIPTLMWITLFYMLRDNGKRQLMNEVHAIIQQRREHNAAKEPEPD